MDLALQDYSMKMAKSESLSNLSQSLPNLSQNLYQPFIVIRVIPTLNLAKNHSKREVILKTAN